MAKLGQYSFRSILLSRLLLLSVPVLLMGVFVTYKKARATLLDTVSQNLTESAIRKGEIIRSSIASLSTNMLTASQSVVLQSNARQEVQQFLNQLSKELPTQVQCVQLTNLKTQKIVASTCENQPVTHFNQSLWPQKLTRSILDKSQVKLQVILPEDLVFTQSNPIKPAKQLELVLSVPVYNSQRQLIYALSVKSTLLKQEVAKPGSLDGNTMVVDQYGKILAHPNAELVGKNIKTQEDGEQIQSLQQQAIAGKPNSPQLLYFEKDNIQLLAGYTTIYSPVSNHIKEKWIIFAVTRLDHALSGLKEIKQGLFYLTLGLIAASLLTTLYIASDLARPVEKLTEYALNEKYLVAIDEIPHNFKIREFNQLSEAVNSMVERLKAWAEELETAWKEAQTANQLKNQFLANTSHELRTPLNAIIGCIRLVRDGCCDNREEEIDFLQRADDAAIHLLGIINDVLDIAKIETGKLSVVMQPVDLSKILKEIIDLQGISIEQKGLILNVPELKVPINVYGDPAKLKQVLLNVLGNATKFTERGSITITIRINDSYSQEQIKDYFEKNDSLEKNKSSSVVPQVMVVVQDTGIGIDPSQQHKLFRPFVMIDGTTTRKFGGTGLGLAISKKLMELMGGNISLYSAGEDQGTRIEITIPLIENPLLPASEIVNQKTYAL